MGVICTNGHTWYRKTEEFWDFWGRWWVHGRGRMPWGKWRNLPRKTGNSCYRCSHLLLIEHCVLVISPAFPPKLCSIYSNTLIYCNLDPSCQGRRQSICPLIWILAVRALLTFSLTCEVNFNRLSSQICRSCRLGDSFVLRRAVKHVWLGLAWLLGPYEDDLWRRAAVEVDTGYFGYLRINFESWKFYCLPATWGGGMITGPPIVRSNLPLQFLRRLLKTVWRIPIRSSCGSLSLGENYVTFWVNCFTTHLCCKVASSR